MPRLGNSGIRNAGRVVVSEPKPCQSGYDVRVKRDGKWRALDLLHLSDDELLYFLKGQTSTKLMQWVAAMVRLVRGVEPGKPLEAVEIDNDD